MKKNLLLAAVALVFAARVVAQTATVTPSASTYNATGGQITFTVSLSYPANVSAVGFAAKPPAATWVYVSTGGTNIPGLQPKVNDITDPANSDSEFGWTYPEEAGPPASSASFTFVLSYPSGLAGNQTFAFSGHTRLAGVRTDISVPSLIIGPPVSPTITGHPANASVNSGASAMFTVAAIGPPTPTIKWQRSIDGGTTFADLSNDTPFSGVATTTLSIAAVGPSFHGHKFRAIASTGVLPDATSNPATLSVNSAPIFVVHPRTQAVATGGSLLLTAVASGFPAATYQWKKGTTSLTDGGRVSGATTSTLTISTVQAGDEGSYSVVATNSIAPDATSNAATITLGPSGFGATHALQGAGYTPGGTVTVTNTINYTGELSSLSWTVLLPTGWSFESAVNAGSPSTQPALNDIGMLEWAWATAPASGSTFTYTVKVPSNAQGTQPLVSLIAYGIGEATLQIVATPDPLNVNQIFNHSGDTNQNFKIDLSELTRVITLYNTRFDTGAGKVRTGCYKLQVGSVDGFATEATRDPAAVGTLGAYHAADYNRNGKIDLSELTRVITLYNTRYDTGAGKVRTGYYKVAVGVTTVDGYTTDPTHVP